MKTAKLTTIIVTMMALAQAPAMAGDMGQPISLENQANRLVVELPRGHIENSRETMHNVFVQQGEHKDYLWLDPGQTGRLTGMFNGGRYIASGVPPIIQSQYRRAIHEGMQDGWVERNSRGYAVIDSEGPTLARGD